MGPEQRLNMFALQVTPAQYISFAVPRPADITIVIADEPVGSSTAHPQKRIAKSLLRSEKWLWQTLEAAKVRMQRYVAIL